MAFPLLIDYFLTHLMQIAVTIIQYCWYPFDEKHPRSEHARPSLSQLFFSCFDFHMMRPLKDEIPMRMKFWTKFKSASSAITNKSGPKKSEFQWRSLLWRQK
jgi:hypothetical protein